MTLFIGCGYYHIDLRAKENNSKFSLPPSLKATLSYNLLASRIFSPKCVGCHGTSGGVSLGTLVSVRQNIPAILRTVFDLHTMPKNGSLSDDEMSLLWSWIEIGAPDNATGGGTGPEPIPLGPTFASLDQNIFQNGCINCHAPGKPAARVPLGKEALLNSPLELVIPGDPDDSGLVIDVERTDPKRMPPAKDGYSPLTDPEKLAIRQWIQNGAKD